MSVNESPEVSVPIQLPVDLPAPYRSRKGREYSGVTVVGTKILSRYQVQKHIGGGGMAQVYLAHDEHSGRRVAIKVMNTEHVRKTRSVERFRREGKLLCRLHHKNLVEGFEMGRFDGRPFIVMEYVDGLNVDELITKRGTLTHHEALNILLQCALGLDHLHREGSVQAHRDIKPTNIMLTESNVVKITDFGISKALDESESMTLTSSFLGSPHYMAPEQILDPRSADIRSDLYALGAVYYEMLTGEKAYPGTGTKEILDAHFDLEPPQLSGDDPLVEFSNDLLIRLLAEDPAQRVQTPLDLVKHLSPVVSDDGTVKVPRFSRSTVRMAALLAGLTIFTGAVIGFVLAAQSPTPAAVAPALADDDDPRDVPESVVETTGVSVAPPTAESPSRSTGSLDVGGAAASGISAGEAARRAVGE